MLALAQSRPPGPRARRPKTPPDTARAAPSSLSKAPGDTARKAAPEPAEISDDARALAGILERRYGKHLKPAQLEAVTREIENRLQGGKRLREVRLANRDEPDFTFRA